VGRICSCDFEPKGTRSVASGELAPRPGVIRPDQAVPRAVQLAVRPLPERGVVVRAGSRRGGPVPLVDVPGLLDHRLDLLPRHLRPPSEWCTPGTGSRRPTCPERPSRSTSTAPGPPPGS